MSTAERSGVATGLLWMPFLAYVEELGGFGWPALLLLLLAPGLAWLGRAAWVVATLALLAGVGFDPLGVPNHHFVLLYLSILLALNGPDRVAARWLYAALMLFATLQKVASPSFRDGSFMAWLTVDGGLCEGPLTLLGLEPWFAHNRALITERPLETHVLAGPLQGLWLWGLVVSWGIIAVEAVLSGLATRGGRGFAGLSIAFVVLLPFVRTELVFTSTLAVLTGIALSGGARRFCWIWAAGAAVAAILVG